MLSDFAGCEAQYGYEGSLKEIYVLITGDFQAPSRMMSWCLIFVAQLRLSLSEFSYKIPFLSLCVLRGSPSRENAVGKIKLQFVRLALPTLVISEIL